MLGDSSEAISNIERKRILELLSKGKRLDGRGVKDYREIRVERGVVEKAAGSALVSIGGTKVIVGVKVEVGEPYPDRPESGALTVNAELTPLASPSFEPGPPDEYSVELARVVDRGLRESKAIDLEKLCLIPGKKVLVVFVDIYVLDQCGNLFDASLLASVSALMSSRVAEYVVGKGGEVKAKSKYVPLPVRSYPVSVTMARIDGDFVVDPSLDEEMVADARITVTTDKDGNVCALQKGGVGVFSVDDVLEAIDVAIEKSEELRRDFLGV